MKYFYLLLLDINIILLLLDITPSIFIKEIESNKIFTIKIDNFKEKFILADDNEYYLNHNLEGKYDIKGSLFADYRTKLSNKIILIYGHNSQTLNVPFKFLENYYNEKFYHKHQIIEIYNNDVHKIYQIYSVFIATNDFFYMNINLDYQLYLAKTKAYSWYTTDIDVTTNDNIILLQTCSFHENYSNYLNKYLIIVGKEIYI